MKDSRYHILLALATGAAHGAEIRRRVDDDSDGQVTLYPATLYGTLDELTEAGWIQEVPGQGDTSRWRFYDLTSEGRRALGAETARLASLVHKAQASLSVAD